jgi:IS605 OrfB family transposase
MMRTVAHGEVWFQPEAARRVAELMRLQYSAVRSAYQAVHKRGLSGNDVRVYVKRNYMTGLNQRYISDACAVASGIKQDHAMFGGRRAWERLRTGALTKAEWSDRRNSQLYSRGDRAKSGNANIRIVGDRLLINDPAAHGRWIEGRLFVPEKWRPGLSETPLYDVRIIRRKNGRFTVAASWETAAPPVTTNRSRGTLGVDANPDVVAVADVSVDGNLLGHRSIGAQRLPFALKEKRDNDVRLLAKDVVDEAARLGKPIALEKLGFSAESRRTGFRKFRRTKSNFVWRKILDAVESRAARSGVEVIPVHPAFTSDLGELKYARMYSMNRHAAAALVIGRRGAGFLERQDFTVTPDAPGSNRVNLEGRSRSLYLTPKAYSWMRRRFMRPGRPKPADLTGPGPAPGSRSGIRLGMVSDDGSEAIFGSLVPVRVDPRANRGSELVAPVDGGVDGSGPVGSGDVQRLSGRRKASLEARGFPRIFLNQEG